MYHGDESQGFRATHIADSRPSHLRGKGSSTIPIHWVPLPVSAKETCNG